MEAYESNFYYYRRKYYDACGEINACESRIYNYKQERKATVKAVNQLQSDIKKTDTAIEKLTDVLSMEESIQTKMLAVQEKTETAAANYTAMVSASDVVSKNLSDVYSTEMAQTRSTMSGVIQTVRTRKNNLDASVADMRANLNEANQYIENLDSQIHTQEGNLSYWKQEKKNAYYNADYYRRKLKEMDIIVYI